MQKIIDTMQPAVEKPKWKLPYHNQQPNKKRQPQWKSKSQKNNKTAYWKEKK
jgi:hypothetical protein